MTIADIKKTAETKMDQSITAFKNNLQKIRTGRANPALLDTVQVEYYGSLVPLSQVANVSAIDARTLSVQPWEILCFSGEDGTGREELLRLLEQVLEQGTEN